MNPLDLVSFWVMCLGDDRSVVPGEKEQSLALLAGMFRNAFSPDTPMSQEGREPPTLRFSSNNHTVDSELWGEEGVRKIEHLQV